MPQKQKLLWIGDIIATTGFARVTENVLERLKNEYEIVVLGCNWHGDPDALQSEYKMYPATNRFQQAPFGEDRIREIVERENPDIVFTMNDIWIVNEQYRRIQDLHKAGKFKFVGYCPMDSYNWIGAISDTANDWDALVSYTEFGAYEFIKGGVRKPISVIPHGLTAGQFYPMDKQEARKTLNLQPDDFIVFNGNRNQPRKRIDITISGFAKFAVGKPDVKLYLHMGLKDQGWDILELFGREMVKQGLDPNGRIIMTAPGPNPPSVSVEMLNTIYNACDVGVNTATGEGWGLCNFEHAGCKVAQIVPDHTSCKEIFEGYGELIRCDHINVDVNYAREMPCPSDDHLAELLDGLYQDRERLRRVGDLCYQRVTDVCFEWGTVAAEFHKVFQEVLEGTFDDTPQAVSPVAFEKKSKKGKKRKGSARELVAV